jgi:tRNA (adenine22-N1)-methyltransferase
MSFSREGDSLSERLKSIRHYHTDQRNIWDIGCDHGLLGLSFKVCDVDSIHLVDPSKPVIDSLMNKLKDAYITKRKIFITQKEGQSLSIDSLSNCLFIAGMGGKEIGEIILHLLPQLDQSSRIVISPHRKILELRKLLNKLPLSLIEEKVMLEEGQYYQILCLSPLEGGQKVSLFGEELWTSETGESYRQHQVKFFTPHQDLASRDYVSHLQGLNPLKTTPKLKS